MSEPIKRSKTEKTIIWAAVFLIVVLLAAIAIPHYIKAHSPSCVVACVNILREIDQAANQFALEHHLTNGSPINFPNDLTPYARYGKFLPCPAGGVYHISKVGETVTCSLGSTVTPAHIGP